MPEVSTAVTIQDQFTGPILPIYDALQTVAAHLESMQDVCQWSLDTSFFDTMRDELAQTSSSLVDLEETAEGMEIKENNLEPVQVEVEAGWESLTAAEVFDTAAVKNMQSETDVLQQKLDKLLSSQKESAAVKIAAPYKLPEIDWDRFSGGDNKKEQMPSDSKVSSEPLAVGGAEAEIRHIKVEIEPPDISVLDELQQMMTLIVAMNAAMQRDITGTMRNQFVQLGEVVNEAGNSAEVLAESMSDLPSTELEAVNQNYIEIQSNTEIIVAEQENLNQAVNDMDATRPAASYNQLDDAVSDIQTSVECNVQKQEEFNEKVKEGTVEASGLGDKVRSFAESFNIMDQVKKAGKWITESLDLANAQISAERQLDVVLKSVDATGAAMEKLKQTAADIQLNGWYSDETMLGGATELLNHMSDMEAVQSMMGTLANFAAGSSGGGEVDASAMAGYAAELGKAMEGSYDGLIEKGFQLTDAQKAVIENGSEMERALVVDEVIRQTWGDLYTEMADYPDHQMIAMQNDIEAIRQEVGIQLYPIIMEITGFIRDNMPLIEMILKLIGAAAGFVAECFAIFLESLTPVIEAVQALFEVFEAATPVIEMIQMILEEVMTLFGEVFAMIIESIVENLVPVFELLMQIVETFIPILLMIMPIVAEMISWFSELFDIIGAIAEVMIENWSLIEPILLGIIAALIIYNGVMLLKTAILGIAAAAQALLNATMWACPLTWIILCIIALIVYIYKIVEAFNEFAGTSISATGVVAGVFMTLFAFLYNSFVTIWNVVVEFINFFANVFKSPIASIKLLFLGLARTVLGYIQKIAEGIEKLLNNIPFIEVSITGGLDNLLSSIDKMSQDIKDESEWEEIVQKKEQMDYESAFKQGYNWGENAGNSLGGLTDGLSNLRNVENGYAYEPDLSSGYGGTGTGAAGSGTGNYGNSGLADTAGNTKATAANTGSTAADTAAIKDTLDITNEELKYLRDIAERDAVNRFTTAELNVTFNANNEISSDMDLDGVVDYLGERINEELTAVAEGVHT